MSSLSFFYAQRRGRMLGQLAVDLFLVGWVVLWWYLGRATERTVDAIATPARSSGDAARQLADQIRRGADQTASDPRASAGSSGSRSTPSPDRCRA